MNATSTRAPARETKRPVTPIVPVCSDHDDECVDVVNKVNCWLYDPAKGFCPFLKGEA